MAYRVLDLFSGIGGFSLGLERAGMETVAFCEIDEQCQKILHKHWPNVPIFPDVSKLSYPEGYVEVICGGFPCQDISVAGRGAGLKGERSGLWFEYKRIIKETKPRYVIIENVANLRTKGLTTVLQDLWEIGYDSEWHIISAVGVGAVHRRERIWIIAYPCDLGQKRSGAEGKQKSKTRIKKTYLDGSLQRVSDERRDAEFSPSNSNGKRLWEQSRGEDIEQRTSTPLTRICGAGDGLVTDPDDLRLGLAIAPQEEKQKWRAETAARFSYLREKVLSTEPAICGGNDGFPRGLDKNRRERIKQLGNAVLPQIPQIIGEAILEYEGLSGQAN
jgi:DNA (cytosine-5)-methyltransferase 1